MKKKLICFLSVILVLVFCGSLAACDDYFANTEIKDEHFKNVNMPLVYQIYLDYTTETGETPLAYDAWFEAVHGDEFQKGIIPEIRKNETTDFWEISYNNGQGWYDLKFKTETAAQKNCNHSFGQWVTICEANEYFNGIRYRSCKNCNYKDYQFKLTDDTCLHLELTIMYGHPATCAKEGLTNGKKCADCGEIVVKQETISKSAHTIVTDAAIKSTCTTTGLTEGSHCSVCQKVLVVQNETPPKGHTYDDEYDVFCNNCGAERDAECAHAEFDIIPGYSATCTSEGLTDGKLCLKCGEMFVQQETVGKMDHTIVIDEKVESTCTTMGLTEGSHCSVCNEVLIAQYDVPLKDHTTVIDEKVESTCTTTGLTEGSHCSACGEILVAQYDAPLKDHTTVIDEKVESTCTTTGLTEGSHCSVCDEILVAQYDVPLKDHTTVIDEKVESTCTTTGLTEGSHCSVCDEILVAQDEIPLKEHNFVDRICTNCGNIYYSQGLSYYLNGDGTCTVTNGECTDTKIYIPPYIDGYKVTGIGDHAFSDRTNITSVEIPDTVISIGDGAFIACINLVNIEIPDSVTSIGDGAFEDCSALKSIEIPGSVISIGNSAFQNCSNLESIELANGITSIGDFAFVYCSSLTNLIIPDSVTSIGVGAFYNCSSLVNISIPDSVMSIGNIAFEGCIGLAYNEYDNAYYLGNNSNPYVVLIKAKDQSVTSCKIHPDTKIIYTNAFNWCSNLTSIVIPDGVTNIGFGSFQVCGFLTSIVIPDSVIIIDDAAFWGCSNLTSIVIPASVTSIGESVLDGCERLESITVEKGNLVYHSAGNCLIETASKTLIAGCKNSIIPADGSVTSIGDSAFSGCSSLTSIVIPDSVTSIGEHAFRNCYSLTSIVIGNSVTSIDWSAFIRCSSLESITVEKGNAVYHSAGNCLIETATKTLIAGCKNSVIPTDGSVTSIGDEAFYYCSSLTSIVIPDSVTSIGEGAFADCSSLTSIEFGGTKAKWNAISKGYDWNYETGNYTIHCTDGDITK